MLVLLSLFTKTYQLFIWWHIQGANYGTVPLYIIATIKGNDAAGIRLSELLARDSCWGIKVLGIYFKRCSQCFSNVSALQCCDKRSHRTGKYYGFDDIEDGSQLRRALPSTHSVFGIPLTANSATYQIVDLISRASKLGGSASGDIMIGSDSFDRTIAHLSYQTTRRDEEYVNRSELWSLLDPSRSSPNRAGIFANGWWQ